MPRASWSLAATCFLVIQLIHQAAWANFGPPPEQREAWEKARQEEEAEKGSVPLVFRNDPKAPVSKLIIPIGLLGDRAKRKPDAKDPKDAGDVAPPGRVGQAAESARMMVAGLAMSLALASLILLRNRSRAIQAACVMAACGVGLLAVAAWSVAGPPHEKSERQPKPNSKVLIEIVQEGDAVQFIRGKR